MYNSIAMNKNITFTANDNLIQQARRRAMEDNTSLNRLFRQWLRQYISQPTAADQFEMLMNRLGHVQAGRVFSREEMNERR